jgi:EpsI family protein
MRTGWRLGVILVLFAAGAVVLHRVPAVKGATNPVSLFALPMTLGAWVGAEGIPEEILPVDPNEKLSVRRTYRNGRQLAWVSVALFVGQDVESRRASVNRIYPQHGVSLIEPVSFGLSLPGSPAMSVTLPAVIVHHQDSHRLLVAYWHQIGNSVYGGEYRFRLALMRELILTRGVDSILVRIATPLGTGLPEADERAVVGGLAPSVYAALRREQVGK